MDKKTEERLFYLLMFGGAGCLLTVSALVPSPLMAILILLGGIMILIGVGIMYDLR